MKSIITRLELGKDPSLNDGLMNGVMLKIPGVVAITGPNGAGKSRLLRRVESLCKIIRSDGLTQEEAIAFAKRDATRARNDGSRAPHVKLEATLRSFEWSGTYSARIRIIQIRPSPPALTPIGDVRIKDLQGVKKAPDVQKILKISATAFVTIQAIANDFLSATHPNTSLREEDRKKAQSRFQAIDAIVNELLGTSIEVRAFNDARLFGRPMNADELSTGQQRLIAFAEAFFEAGDIDSPTVVILDEPENHLHPQAIIQVLDKIKKFATNAQIWIATHSLALLASLDPKSIWCMQKGNLSYAGTRTIDVLESLMGGDQNVEKRSLFLSSPTDFAINSFVTECLLPPSVVDTPLGDPQTSQIAEHIASFSGPTIKIIDWGAGRGRLAKTLREVGSGSEASPISIDYFAFDPSPAYRNECLDSMEGFVDSPQSHHFQLISELAACFDRDRAGVVTMCNVLHEIPPSDWVRVLGCDIAQVLRPDGFLLIAEDLIMPHGELAHRDGFVVLDPTGIGHLFDDVNEEIVISSSSDPRYHNRLFAYLVPATLLGKVSQSSIHNACSWQRDHSKRRIKEMREHPLKDHRTGRELAFQLAQFANASLVLDSLGSNP